MVNLYAVLKVGSGYESCHLLSFRYGGDLRLFNSEVPAWPEALDAARIGKQLAQELGVDFHFPSPQHPEDNCPHWWEIAQSSPCSRCNIQLLQPQDYLWRGVCSRCHIAIEREAREARWSPEERAAPRCFLCGTPVVGELGEAPQCKSCRERYRIFLCTTCGQQVTIWRDSYTSDVCSSCEIAAQLDALPEQDRKRILEATVADTTTVLFEACDLLDCSLPDLESALAELRRRSVVG